MDLADILYKLGNCENGLRTTGCIIDVNGFLSCGLFMYQQKTWDSLCEGDIMNPSDQMECTVKILMSGGWGHWRNCFLNNNIQII